AGERMFLRSPKAFDSQRGAKRKAISPRIKKVALPQAPFFSSWSIRSLLRFEIGEDLTSCFSAFGDMKRRWKSQGRTLKSDRAAEETRAKDLSQTSTGPVGRC